MKTNKVFNQEIHWDRDVENMPSRERIIAVIKYNAHVIYCPVVNSEIVAGYIDHYGDDNSALYDHKGEFICVIDDIVAWAHISCPPYEKKKKGRFDKKELSKFSDENTKVIDLTGVDLDSQSLVGDDGIVETSFLENQND